MSTAFSVSHEKVIIFHSNAEILPVLSDEVTNRPLASLSVDYHHGDSFIRIILETNPYAPELGCMDYISTYEISNFTLSQSTERNRDENIPEEKRLFDLINQLLDARNLFFVLGEEGKSVDMKISSGPLFVAIGTLPLKIERDPRSLPSERDLAIQKASYYVEGTNIFKLTPGIYSGGEAFCRRIPDDVESLHLTKKPSALFEDSYSVDEMTPRGLVYFKNLRHLTIDSVKMQNSTDIYFLYKLQNLESLTLKNIPELLDLQIIKKMCKLETLSIINCANLSDISEVINHRSIRQKIIIGCPLVSNEIKRLAGV